MDVQRGVIGLNIGFVFTEPENIVLATVNSSYNIDMTVTVPHHGSSVLYLIMGGRFKREMLINIRTF